MKQKEKFAIKDLIYQVGGYEEARKICSLKTAGAISQWVRRGRIPPLHEKKLYTVLGLKWQYQKS